MKIARALLGINHPSALAWCFKIICRLMVVWLNEGVGGLGRFLMTAVVQCLPGQSPSSSPLPSLPEEAERTGGWRGVRGEVQAGRASTAGHAELTPVPLGWIGSFSGAVKLR